MKVSSYRDRTHEFDALKKTLLSSSDYYSNAAVGNVAIAFQLEFNKRASTISFGIHHASQNVAKLDKLTKSTSVFNDPTIEIQALKADIEQEITTLNSAIVDLQLLSNSQNQSENVSSDTATHSTIVVDNLKNRLMSTTKEFKDVLTMRTENLKVHENRRQLFSATTPVETANPFVRERPLANKSTASASNSLPPWANDSSSSSPLFQREHADGESQPLIQQQNQQQQQMVSLQDGYTESRAEALQNVASTVQDLHNIFTQLVTTVSEQGELVIRIDENMEDTLANVEALQGQLMRYLNSMLSNQWLMIKIFFVLIAFLMFYLFFFA